MGRRSDTGPDGLLVVDKPRGMTSHDVVSRVRRLAGTRRVGHAGTLDPMATGVLVIGVGRATRLLTHIVGADKAYSATIRLGVGTDSDDADGSITGYGDVSSIDDGAVSRVVAGLTGQIMQVPSSVSAFKVDGKRAYALAREGAEVNLRARPVTVSRFAVLASSHLVVDGRGVVDVDVDVECSTGTYVRALARDLGAGLGVPAHLTALRRTRVGGYGLDRAATLDDLARIVDGGGSVPLVGLAEAAGAMFPVYGVSQQERTALGYGQWLRPDVDSSVTAAGLVEGDTWCAVADDGALIALVTVTGDRLKPSLVFEQSGTGG